MTSFNFRETLMGHLLLYGNAYAQIIRNGKGEVIGLYPLMPTKMTVDRDSKGQIYYLYTRGSDDSPVDDENGQVYLPPEQVLFVGDQIFTDCLAAHRAGVDCYLVKPIKSKETFFFRLKRAFEKPFLSIYRRRRIKSKGCN